MENIIVSACLLGIGCRYDGKHKANPDVIRLTEKYNLIPVCPEIYGGLPTPRVPSERIGDKVMMKDGRDVTVLDLLPADVRTRGMFPCGRLDKNTLGLVLLTDDGELAHRLLAPKSHVKKLYRYSSKFPVSPEDAQRFEAGLVLEDGYETKPAEIRLDDDRLGGYITLVEGKYHQIKRMLEALDNKITYLERVEFGPLTLDPMLDRGEWRYLTEDEIALLREHAKQ